MSLEELTERLLTLEREVELLKHRLRKPEKDWQSTVGVFDGDETFAEMVREGRKYREELRRTDTE